MNRKLILNNSILSVSDNFGVATYAVYLFVLTIWWSKVWGDSTACPYNHMEDMIEGKTSPRDVALKTWAQLMGGCCVWRIVQFFWWLELAETHQGKAFEDCSADLQVRENENLATETSPMFSVLVKSLFLGIPSGWCFRWRRRHASLPVGFENSQREEPKVHDRPRQFHWNVARRSW